MQKLLLTIIYSITFFTANAQAPKLEWATKLGGTGNDGGKSVAIDAKGNVYTAGVFNGTADFNPGTGTYNLISAGALDVFISKLDAKGNFVWAKQFAGRLDEYAQSIVLDKAGNIYTLGCFYNDTVDFDPGAGTFNLSSKDYDMFISKLDSAGNFVWAKKMSGDKLQRGFGLTLDASGNIYTTGEFTGTVDFDPGSGTSNVTATALDIFISKLDASGNFVWVKTLGNSITLRSNSIAIDASGNVLTTGVFLTTLDFDPGPGTFNLTSKFNYNNSYVLKLDANGNFIWAKNIGAAFSTSIALDASGNVYTTGYFKDTVDFDPGTGKFNLISKIYDMFVSKLDANGTFVWARNMGGTSGTYGQSITLDASGNVYTTGHFALTTDFDPGTGTFYLSSPNDNNMFISKLDANGKFVWAGNTSGPSIQFGDCIKLDAAGNIYVTGLFADTADFDPGSGKFNLSAFGQTSDAYILKLSNKTGKISNTTPGTISIYPNPSSGIVNIDLKNGPGNAIQIQVLNTLGQVLKEQTSITQHSIIDIQNLPQGLYFIKVISDDQTVFTQRIIKR